MVVAVPTYHFLDKIGHAKSIPKWQCQMEMLHKKSENWENSYKSLGAQHFTHTNTHGRYFQNRLISSKNVSRRFPFSDHEEKTRIGTEYGESQSDAHQSPRSRHIFLLTYPTQLQEIGVAAAAANGERTEDNSQTSYRVVIVCAEEADRSGITCVRMITTTTTTRTISTKNKSFAKTRCIS